MTDGDSISQVAIVILLLSLSAPALATAHEYAGTPIEYEESLTVDYGNESNVSEPATVEGYGADPTVTVNGSELVEGTDYDWDSSTGNVTWYDTANSSDGDSATIRYAAYQRTEETAVSWTILAPLMSLFGLFGLVVSVRALWSFTAEVWDL